MSDFKIDARQLKTLDRNLSRAGIDYKKGVKRLLKELGEKITILSKKYCPVSMNKAQYKSTLQDFETMRDNTSFTTGALMDSITYDTGPDFVSIGVPSNSPGGKYAEKIHNEKGKSWLNRGIGTQRKGRQADEKFIYRAVDDSAKHIDTLIDKVVNDLTKELIR